SAGRAHTWAWTIYLPHPPPAAPCAPAGRTAPPLTAEPLGPDGQGKPVYLRDIWPSQREISETIRTSVQPGTFSKVYSDVFKGDAQWNTISVPAGDLFAWDAKSTYVKHAPYFENMPAKPAPIQDIRGARVLAVLGDSITTDHISPPGSIKKDSPAGKYLIEHPRPPHQFNSHSP